MSKPNDNSINLKHGGGIVNRKDQDEPTQQPIDSSKESPYAQDSNRYDIKVAPMVGGGILPPGSVGQFNEKDWKYFYKAVKEFCWNNINVPLDNLIGCVGSHPDKPAYTRGWIFNGLVPSFAPCGCYREAIWPSKIFFPQNHVDYLEIFHLMSKIIY